MTDRICQNHGNDTLVLNSDGFPLTVLPLSTITWRDTFTNLAQGKVEALQVYDNWIIHSAHAEYAVPAVVIMLDWVRVCRTVKLNRNNLYLRDRFTCQYCGVCYPKDKLTLDHVYPKSAGGGYTWSNLTTACRQCNHLKGNAMVGWSPISQPKKPSYGDLLKSSKERPISIRHHSWNYYLGWPDELIYLQK
jgi:5-methylcytosine-specific restriction endonuclease McrA